MIENFSTQLPSFFIKDTLDSDQWKNIPIPLISAIDTIKRSLINTENILVKLGLECRKKNEAIVFKFKELEKK